MNKFHIRMKILYAIKSDDLFLYHLFIKYYNKLLYPSKQTNNFTVLENFLLNHNKHQENVTVNHEVITMSLCKNKAIYGFLKVTH